jgi:hypothetical protein
MMMRSATLVLVEIECEHKLPVSKVSGPSEMGFEMIRNRKRKQISEELDREIPIL